MRFGRIMCYWRFSRSLWLDNSRVKCVPFSLRSGGLTSKKWGVYPLVPHLSTPVPGTVAYHSTYWTLPKRYRFSWHVSLSNAIGHNQKWKVLQAVADLEGASRGSCPPCLSREGNAPPWSPRGNSQFSHIFHFSYTTSFPIFSIFFLFINDSLPIHILKS